MITYAAFISALVLFRLAFQPLSPRVRALVILGVVAALATAIVAGPDLAVARKALGLLVMPLGLLALSALALAYLAWWRGQRAWSGAFYAIHVAILIAGSPLLASEGLDYVEGPYSDVDPYRLPAFDAIIVLGGGTSERPTGEPQLARSGDRVMLAARLYRRGLTPRLIASGAPIDGFSDHDSAQAAATIWQDLGVPSEAIEIVEGARTTGEEAHLHAAMVRTRGFRRVGLITSAFHMTRALSCFDREGLEPIPLPADVRSRPAEYRGFIALVPTAAAAETGHTVMWELIGRRTGC